MAEKGKGAFLADRTGRDRRLRVAARKKLGDCLLTTGIPHSGRPRHDRFLRETEHLMKEVSGIRRTGSAATDLAWVAAGRFDAYYEHNLGAWDIAAGTVLVRDWHGQQIRVTVIADGYELNGRTFRSLSAIARHVTQTRWNGRLWFGLAPTRSRS